MSTRTMSLALTLLAALALVAACGNGGAKQAAAKDQQEAARPKPAPPAPAPLPGKGEVLETMEAGGYTYVRVKIGEAEVWAAGPQVALAAKDIVELPGGMPMANYTSPSLGRTFEVVYFVGAIKVVGGKDGAASTVKEAHKQAAPAKVEVGKVDKVAGGKTVAEIFAEAKALAGKEVKVRGRVVKFNAQIMGRNWIHIQDGSGDKGTNDLTITTSETTAVGDLIVVTGKVAIDQAFGGGIYKYPVMLEDGKVTKE